MGEMKSITPLRIAAQQVIDAENTLCGQLREVINSAFGYKVVTNVKVNPTGIGLNFEVAGRWELPENLWFKPISQGN
jgi:RNase adaptor protein for sRNA GlmZ degradation